MAAAKPSRSRAIRSDMNNTSSGYSRKNISV